MAEDLISVVRFLYRRYILRWQANPESAPVTTILGLVLDSSVIDPG